MIEKAITRIIKLSEVKILEIGGRTYTTGSVIPVKQPTPEVLKIHTLSGLVDYLNKNNETTLETTYQEAI